jgi:hypothetical protein
MQFVFPTSHDEAMVVLEHMNYYGAGDGPTELSSTAVLYYDCPDVHFVAFTGLLKFYHAVDKDFVVSTLCQILVHQGVVFMTFGRDWQVVSWRKRRYIGGASADGGSEEWAKSAQNFWLSRNALVFCAHFVPTDEWEELPGEAQPGSIRGTVLLWGISFQLKLLLK